MADLASAFSPDGQANVVCSRPLGDKTTVIDLADRDRFDDELFPLMSDKTLFIKDSERRVLPFAPTIQEFAYKGSAEFGGRIVFDLGSVKACDILFSVALQLRLGHWLPPYVIQLIQGEAYQYQDPTRAWLYANRLGAVLIESAEFLLEDQTLEKIDGDFANIFSDLFSDINSQFGLSTDAYGSYTKPDVSDLTQVFPTSNGYITCILPFSFQRVRLREGFPLISVKEGTVRVVITLRPFDQVVRMLSVNRQTCNQVPLSITVPMIDKTVSPSVVIQITSNLVEPPFEDIRLVTYGMMVDGKFRNALLRAPFDRLYREVQSFRFAEPLKYISSGADIGQIRIQLPLELNHPIEEIIWIVRRKAVAINNEWTNYSAVLECEYDPVFNPRRGLLVNASIQVNGETVVYGSADFFRQQIAEAHKGGVVSYKNYIYGYSFAKTPGEHDPSGSINTSRSTDVRLRLDILPPDGTYSAEWEVLVYAIGLNWIRFENGLANRIFSS
jgi:hypothetical protein